MIAARSAYEKLPAHQCQSEYSQQAEDPNGLTLSPSHVCFVLLQTVISPDVTVWSVDLRLHQAQDHTAESPLPGGGRRKVGKLRPGGPPPSRITSLSQFLSADMAAVPARAIRARARGATPSRELWMREIQVTAVLSTRGLSSSSGPPPQRTGATAMIRIPNSHHRERH
jgi:hypothetical protein